MTVRSSVDVESTVERIRPHVRRSPLRGFEHQRGWGILAFPFDSGHVLAHRVVPQNDFAPYTSVWHRTPDGTWSIYVDGPRLDTACPRYWEPATERVRLTDISVEWTGPAELVVEMGDPQLRWTASMDAGPVVRAANAASCRLPEPMLRWRPMVRFAERIADRLFDLGDVTLATPVPAGQEATVLARRLFPVVDGSARLDGMDLGKPTVESAPPTIGEARLPASPVLWVGRAYLTIVDDEEYERTVDEVRRERRSVDEERRGRQSIDGRRERQSNDGRRERRSNDGRGPAGRPAGHQEGG